MEHDGFDVSVDGSEIRVVGELDALSAHRLTEVVDQMIAAGSALRIDLSGVTFIDSMGLRVLLRADQDAELTVLRPSDAVRRLLGLTGLDDRFRVEQ